jgi:parallel beta-helix repeat protein
VTIETGVTLTIEPGVEVRFVGFYYIRVYGNLTAVGNSTDRIVITSDNLSPSPGDWEAIKVSSTGNILIDRCNISYSQNGLFMWDSSSNVITNSSFANNGASAIMVKESNNITISYNNFLNNPDRCIDFQGPSSNNTVTYNNFMSNSKAIAASRVTKSIITYNNLSTDSYGIDISSSSHNIIANNKFSDHSEAAIDAINISFTLIVNNSFWNNDDGIDLGSNNEVLIANNSIINSSDAIRVGWSSSCSIMFNKIFYSDIRGIDLSEVSSITVSNNNIFDSNIGIELDGFFSKRNIIKNNNISNNSIGVYLDDYIENNTIINNNISDNNVGVQLLGYVGYYKSNTVTNNTISDSTIGVQLMEFSSNNTVVNNIILNNSVDGISFQNNSGNNTIENNNISQNARGISFFMRSNSNTVRNNNISENGIGVEMDVETYNNSVYHNFFWNNTIQARDNTSNGNKWDNSYPSGGNYWSDFDEPSEGAYDDYQGPDQDLPGSDCKVDKGFFAGGGKNPYVIDSDSQDNYPLIEPTKEFLILKQGWNLISIPLIQEEQDLKKVLNFIDGLYDAVQWYDITDIDDHWKHHKVGKPFGNDLFQINEKMGFWIHITQPGDTIFYINGTRIFQNQTITLHEGWNLVGYPSRTNKNRTAALNNLTFGDDIDSIWTYNATTQKWKEIGESDYFEVGKGYWVHSKVKKTWEVPL